MRLNQKNLIPQFLFNNKKWIFVRLKNSFNQNISFYLNRNLYFCEYIKHEPDVDQQSIQHIEMQSAFNYKQLN
jgi:hypothetical protein